MKKQSEKALTLLRKKHEHKLDMLQQKMVQWQRELDAVAGEIEQLELRIDEYESALCSSFNLTLANNIRQYLNGLYDKVEPLKRKQNEIDSKIDAVSLQINKELIEKRKANTLIEKHRLDNIRVINQKNDKQIDDLWLMMLGSKRKW